MANTTDFRHAQRNSFYLEQRLKTLRKATNINIANYDQEKNKIHRLKAELDISSQGCETNGSTSLDIQDAKGPKLKHAIFETRKNEGSEGGPVERVGLPSSRLKLPATELKSESNGHSSRSGKGSTSLNGWGFLTGLYNKTKPRNLNGNSDFSMRYRHFRLPSFRYWGESKRPTLFKCTQRVLVKPAQPPISIKRLAELATPACFKQGTGREPVSRESREMARPRSINRLRSLVGREYTDLVKPGDLSDRKFFVRQKTVPKLSFVGQAESVRTSGDSVEQFRDKRRTPQIRDAANSWSRARVYTTRAMSMAPSTYRSRDLRSCEHACVPSVADLSTCRYLYTYKPERTLTNDEIFQK